jgi:hypothetical protein
MKNTVENAKKFYFEKGLKISIPFIMFDYANEIEYGRSSLNSLSDKDEDEIMGAWITKQRTKNSMKRPKIAKVKILWINQM